MTWEPAPRPPQPYPAPPPPPLGHPAPLTGRSPALVPLAVVVALLVFGLVGTGVFWYVRTSTAHSRITQLKDEHAAHEKGKADEAAARAARLAEADLAGKFEAVKSANEKLVTEVNAWGVRSESEKFRTLHTSQELRSRCLESVVTYNAAAAPFTAEERGDLPPEVDMTDTLYDCLTDNWSVST